MIQHPSPEIWTKANPIKSAIVVRDNLKITLGLGDIQPQGTYRFSGSGVDKLPAEPFATFCFEARASIRLKFRLLQVQTV